MSQGSAHLRGPPAPGPSSMLRDMAGTYPLAADHRTTVSLSFRPISSCSGGRQKGRSVSSGVAASPPASPLPLTESMLRGDSVEKLNARYEKRVFPSLCFDRKPPEAHVCRCS